MILRKRNPKLIAPMPATLHGLAILSALQLVTVCFLVSCAGRGSHDDHYHPNFGSAKQASKHEIIFGAPSLGYFETTDLTLKYLNSHLDTAKVRAVACSSVEDYEEKLRRGFFDFTVINGPQLILALESGYTIVGRITDPYRSIFLVNKDSGIDNLGDCRGHTIALTGNRVLAGSVMPLMYLYQHGVDVNKDLRRLFSPSYESVLLDVCLGKCAMGAVWTTSYENFQRKRPELASHLEPRWLTPPLPSSAILFRKGLDAGIVKKISMLLYGLQNDDKGREALQRIGVGSFEPADSTHYIPMRQLLKKYDSLIH